ncbi:MAG: imidazole glycerol phosphate synthase subunit HisH [Caulobacteraceae bacterium]
MEKVVVVDYGSGNLRSAEKALQRAALETGGSAEVLASSDPDQIASAQRIVLPGVGAFRACMDALSARDGLIEAMSFAVRKRGAPFLGICVGMQLLASRGLEFESVRGLDWIGGETRALAVPDRRTRLPHMGWNTLRGPMPAELFGGLAAEPHMYFTHSFAFFPSEESSVAAWCDHGEAFPAAVMFENLAGVQFHPEKSQDLGLVLLANFLGWTP